MSTIALRPPTQLAGRLYAANASPGGAWTLHVLSDAGSEILLTAATERELAEAMLRDAFPGHLVRPDLIDALVAEWDPPDGGFVLPADLIAGWSLRWALDRT
ncbi:hypothetical protein DVA67_014495 [Solirubrobacter sp. CPCC 204708]|uniref:Uncharacterized protein n=1 Tax=Solirubrobacter deserti TaxID=2282478 RepID=A0ABT4RBK8_9ACTN|nr:hypothetical protein [Solirubrobacter deserti]MBE2317188.1 hypothetical protein [Solirubrobacter deserti]MDA0135919.1 hypothetical protein [Solirubrobacter deserti]